MARQAEVAASLQRLRRGDLILVPAGAGGPGVALVIGRARRALPPLPLVLTVNHQVKRLSLADFPVPVTAFDRVRIPAWFSARSAKHRRDLVSTVRNKLAGHDLSQQPGR